MLEEFDPTTMLDNPQLEHDHDDQFEPTEKNLIEQRMLEMESLLYAVVHENTNLRARLEGLEIQNAPIVAIEIVVPPVAANASNPAVQHVKPPKPPMRLQPTIQSDEGSSSTRSVTSRRVENQQQKPNDAPHHPEATARSSVFRRLGAEARRPEKEPARSNSNLRAHGNNV